MLVWIHGGAFLNGSGAVTAYDGTTFARDGVVTVTISYRLGTDGFLFTAADRAAGTANLGLQDMVAALRWVQQNIGRLGGDPSMVTVAGESADLDAVVTAAGQLFGQVQPRRCSSMSGPVPSRPLSPRTRPPTPWLPSLAVEARRRRTV